MTTIETLPESVANATKSSARSRTTNWVHNPVTDVIMAFCWIPFAIAAAVGINNQEYTQWLLGMTLLFSFCHQPLTMALVFGDKDQFNLKRKVFLGSLVVFPVAILLLAELSFLTLALIAGGWNAVHTLRQRYGITQIYARKVGQNQGKLENRMLFSWLIFVAAYAGANANTPAQLEASGLGKRNAAAVNVLTGASELMQVLMYVVGATAVMLTAWWLFNELTAPKQNTAKQLYVGSTAVLFGVFLLNPIVGLIAYVGSHALEYFIIVHQHLGKRYGSHAGETKATIAKAVRTPVGRPGFFAIYIVVLLGSVALIRNYTTKEIHMATVLTLGACHVFWDGFIWKLRRPEQQQTFGLQKA